MENTSLILACSSCGAKNRVPQARVNENPVCGKCKTALPVENLSKPVDVTDATFDSEVMGSDLPVMVDCWAPWCGPCRAFAPVLDELAVKYKARLKIAKLNVDENPVTGSRYSISSVPTLLFIKNGQVKNQIAGALPKDHLEEQIAKIL